MFLEASTCAFTSANVYVRPSEKSWSQGTRTALRPRTERWKSLSVLKTVGPGAASGFGMSYSPGV